MNDALFIEEVVVVGYSNSDDVAISSELEDLSDISTVETKRVIDALPKIVADKYLGKTPGP